MILSHYMNLNKNREQGVENYLQQKIHRKKFTELVE